MRLPHIVNLPRTQTILAIGTLAGCFWSMDDWRDIMLVIVGYYFGRAEQRQPHPSDPIQTTVTAPAGTAVSVATETKGTPE